jgi:hypothetical protein
VNTGNSLIQKSINSENMKNLIPAVAIMTILIIAGSCYYDSEEALYPDLNTSCDTTNITFGVTITQILKDNCYSCHSNSKAASNGGNIRLQDFADVAGSSSLYDAVQHKGTAMPMPKNGGKLNDCAINQINIWFRDGKLNN